MVRTFRRWDCINARQRERAKEARFAARTSLLTSPATRKPPPKCGAFRLQPRGSPGPALFGEAIADQAASCVEQPSVRPLNGHGDGFGKATSGILIATLGALRARLCSLATRYRR